ncbi:MAG TPA: protein-L-isoaspartate(D-aspartate) O-methyltransferase [Candidatus Dormibacteraeota bacterium]|nr:protein-L-isoaspartate(D-aspartate) O-methyltransferase [Candidatus Dormibacteraeota bacterium]
MSILRNKDAVDPANAGSGSGDFAAQRAAMVEKQIRGRGIADPLVLGAMLEVPRHEFIPTTSLAEAYADKPLSIGEGQTISQPYMVAAMTAALGLGGSERVLEVGTGCGYQAAVLSHLAAEVYSIESRGPLALAARARLERLGYKNVHVHCGDGTLGLAECAPFDAILVTAAAPAIPEPLVQQLGASGRMVIPVGSSEYQKLTLLQKNGGEMTTRVLEECRFVPLIGRHGWSKPFHE